MAEPIKSQYSFKLNYFDVSRINYVTIEVKQQNGEMWKSLAIRWLDHRCLGYSYYNCLKPEQRLTVKESVKPRAVSPVLPKGHGKSLCYTCLQ